MLSTVLHELDRLEARAGLVLAGYLLAGAPPALVEVYLRPGRTADERRQLVLQMNGRKVTPEPVTRSV